MTDDAQEMIRKLDHILHHWKEHNRSHGEGYEKWIRTAQRLDREDVAREIREALALSREMNVHFEKAQELLKGEDDV